MLFDSFENVQRLSADLRLLAPPVSKFTSNTQRLSFNSCHAVKYYTGIATHCSGKRYRAVEIFPSSTTTVQVPDKPGQPKNFLAGLVVARLRPDRIDGPRRFMANHYGQFGRIWI